MDGIINLLRALFYRNKVFFVIAIFAILVLIVGCSNQGSSPPPSGPIGGGC